MRFTLSSILVAGAGIFLAAANAAGGPKPTDYPFILRAWHDPRDVQYPHIDRNVELDSGGRAVINKTENYPGFSSYISPTPELGTLHTLKTEKRGFLLPVHYPDMPPYPPHYQLMYGNGIPKIAGVLYSNFTTYGRGCGGHCGGATLDYDRGTGVFGDWYIIPSDSGPRPSRQVWALRWISRKVSSDPIIYPRGAIPVFLWKSAA